MKSNFKFVTLIVVVIATLFTSSYVLTHNKF